MYFVPEAQHDRSQARSAWDSATPKEPYEIGRCEGRSIDKGRIIGLDPSKISKPPKLRLATGEGVFSVRISQARPVTLSSSSNIMGDKPFKKSS
jgi:hypothetical protein